MQNDEQNTSTEDHKKMAKWSNDRVKYLEAMISLYLSILQTFIVDEEASLQVFVFD